MPGEYHEAHFGYYPMHQLTVAPRVCHLGICGQGRCAEGPIQDISTRGDALGVPVGKVSVPKTGQYSSFATPGCLWGTCGHGGRAEEQSEVPLCHAITCIRCAPPASRVRGIIHLSESSAVRCHRSS